MLYPRFSVVVLQMSYFGEITVLIRKRSGCQHEGSDMSDKADLQEQHGRQRRQMRLGHLKQAHEQMMKAVIEEQSALLELPASDLADLPVERETQYRFTGLMKDAKAMAGRWDNLAHEYELLANEMLSLCDSQEAREERG